MNKKKKYRIMLICILCGLAGAVCMHISSRMHTKLSEGTHLFRNEWGGGSYLVVLQGDSAFGSETVTYEIKERRYTKEELEQLRSKALILLKQKILLKNPSLDQVSDRLELVTELADYPFQISWKSSNVERVMPSGKVNAANVESTGEGVVLTAVFCYEAERWEEEIRIRVVPTVLTPEQQYRAAVEELLKENDLLYESEKRVVLPTEIQEEAIIWKEVIQDHSILYLLLGFLAAILIPMGMEYDIRKKEEEAREHMKRAYPGFISKLQLYMGAGLSIRSAFLRMGKEYEEERGKRKKKELLYEELLIADHQLLNGRPEEKVYSEFAMRCKDMRYRKLVFLLVSSLKQGNDKILLFLSEEVTAALEERKNAARKKGEEAGTKLLFPMLMMLMIVMFLILLPVFSDFRGAV